MEGGVMAGNTKCYRVTVKPDGTLDNEVVEFSQRFADSIANALMRLHHRATMQSPYVKFADWEKLQAAWETERGK
jgi:dissimilatory sulfite reductase (desulfoviridin) alpha/beta subunit